MKCPDCNGDRQIIASHVSYADGTHGYGVPMACARCKATGEVDDRTPQWIEIGERMRQDRVHGGNYRRLHVEAKRRGMDVVTLSRMERGEIEPIPEAGDR